MRNEYGINEREKEIINLLGLKSNIYDREGEVSSELRLTDWCNVLTNISFLTDAVLVYGGIYFEIYVPKLKKEKNRYDHCKTNNMELKVCFNDKSESMVFYYHLDLDIWRQPTIREAEEKLNEGALAFLSVQKLIESKYGERAIELGVIKVNNYYARETNYHTTWIDPIHKYRNELLRIVRDVYGYKGGRLTGKSQIQIKEAPPSECCSAGIFLDIQIKKNRQPIALNNKYDFSIKTYRGHSDRGHNGVFTEVWKALWLEEITEKISTPLKEKINNLEQQIEYKKSKSKAYLMVCGHSGLVKIGKSKDPSKRERTLQSKAPLTRLMVVFDYDVEKELHKKYAAFRRRGEWFDLTKDQIFDIIAENVCEVTTPKILKEFVKAV